MQPAGEKLTEIVLLGAGAVGILPAAKLLGVPDVSLRCAADTVRVKRYRRDGIYFNGELLDLEFFSPDEADKLPKADLVIAATKVPDLSDALDNIRGVADRKTIFLPLLNGINAHEIIAGKFPGNPVLRGFFLGHASVREGNQIRHDGVGTFYCGGEPEVLAPVQELFLRAGVNIRIPENMDQAVWKKFILNVGINQAQAFFKADYAAVQNNPEILDFCRELMLEAAACARAQMITDTEKMIDDAMQVILSMPGNVKTSMLQDVLAGRRTEVDAFAGTICRIARKHNIPVPANELVLEKIF